MGVAIEAAFEPGGVKPQLLGQPDCACALIEAVEALRRDWFGPGHVGVVELPEGALIGGAFDRFGDELALRVLEDVDELDPGESASDHCFDDLRLSLSRVPLAEGSQEVAVVDDQDGGLGMSEEVAVVEDAGEFAFLDRGRIDLGAHGSAAVVEAAGG